MTAGGSTGRLAAYDSLQGAPTPVLPDGTPGAIKASPASCPQLQLVARRQLRAVGRRVRMEPALNAHARLLLSEHLLQRGGAPGREQLKRGWCGKVDAPRMRMRGLILRA